MVIIKNILGIVASILTIIVNGYKILKHLRHRK